jgi:hypothetical protein
MQFQLPQGQGRGQPCDMAAGPVLTPSPPPSALLQTAQVGPFANSFFTHGWLAQVGLVPT